MPPPRLYKTAAIVLKRFDLGEADRVLTVLTPHDGKLRLIAKGVRRPTSRLGGTLEPFAELQLVVARARTFDVVTQASVNEAWLNLR
ncbi:MAG TPA: recombination protein O N-terminal domain-containing protein, partial [Candidatus Sulfotelmatobacter sp.]|nr:recombination protein O N-terminal domain-containing protein [Candidatus Sulfotelmatobacter sp.]